MAYPLRAFYSRHAELTSTYPCIFASKTRYDELLQLEQSAIQQRCPAGTN
jgi:hypothetical protein